MDACVSLAQSLPTQVWGLERDAGELSEDARICKIKRHRCLSSGASRGAPHGLAILKVRKGAFDALNKGSGALGGKVK